MKITNGVKGFYKMEAFKTNADGSEVPGSRREVAPWFPNLILDAGLEYMGTASFQWQFCQVGSGATPPTVSDTALVSRVAGTNQTQSSVTGAQPSSPYFGWRRKTFRFNEGVAAGNLSEVGVGWATTGSLFSRALILDPGGTPTTISVGADESLDVTYEIRFYPPEVDSTGTVNIGGVDYDWTARAANVTGTSEWTGGASGANVNFTSATAYNNVIGAITGLPTGTSTLITATRNGYSAASLKIGTTLSASLTSGNLSGGIRSVAVRALGGGVGAYQIQFDPAIPKDNTKVFSLTFEVAWTRQP